MKAGRLAVLALVLGCMPFAAAQHRFNPEALVGIDQVPFVVNDLAAARDLWRNLGFLVKPGKPRADGTEYAQIRFEDGSGIELVSVVEPGAERAQRYAELLQQAEGPALLSLHARDLGALSAALEGSPLKYGTVSRTFGVPTLDYLSVTQDSRAPDDAAWLEHRNGASALSRVWLAMPRRDSRDLARLMGAVNGEPTGAKIYAPRAVQATVATVSNGELLILPEELQLTPGRRVIGVTFEVESLATLRRRLADFGIAYSSGGAQDRSLIVAPDLMHGMWVEFRE